MSDQTVLLPQKDSFITDILFELCLFSNLAQSTFFGTHFIQQIEIMVRHMVSKTTMLRVEAATAGKFALNVF